MTPDGESQVPRRTRAGFCCHHGLVAHQERYELLNVIGAGGMATVWRAHDTSLGRTVALKRPHPAPHDSIVHERFQREARAAAMVSHPNLVTVFDTGVDEEGPFLVMEYVDAPSLADTSDHDDAAVIGAQIAAALAALHAAGVIHRDVKPANILLAAGGAQLTDFGIARSIDEAAGLTQAGMTFATPAYAAPEVLAQGSYSESSDIYSLAAVLFEIVQGQRVTPSSGTQLLVTDPFWKSILDDSLAPDPVGRPTAADFERRLRAASTGAATTLMPLTGSDLMASTLPLNLPDGPVDVAPSDGSVSDAASDDSFRYQPLLAITAVVAVLVAGLIVLAVSRSGDDELGFVSAATTISNVATSPPDTISETTTPAATQSTTPATTPPTVAAVVDEVDAARADFAAFIEALSGNQLKGNDAKKVIAEVDDVLALVAAGKLDEAQSLLDRSLDRLDEIKSDDAAEGATLRLERLADAIGLDSD